MSHSRILSALLVAGLAFSAINAEEKKADTTKKKVSYTTIQIHNMHCINCAKKIAKQLYGVKGVKEVRADVKKNRAYIVPVKKKKPTSYEMWVAVEKSGFKPLKIWGPDGTYSKKPPKPATLTAKAGTTTTIK